MMDKSDKPNTNIHIIAFTRLFRSLCVILNLSILFPSNTIQFYVKFFWSESIFSFYTFNFVYLYYHLMYFFRLFI